MHKKKYLKTRSLFAITLCASTFLSLTACQKSPEKSVVVNKDLDKLIEQAQNPEENKDAGESALEADGQQYKTTIEDEKLKVKVVVDAQVEVPKAEKLSMFRVGHQEITQELVDNVRRELMGEASLYDGAALDQLTKSRIEDEIASHRRELEMMEENGYKDSDSYKEFQSDINSLERIYNETPSEIIFDNYNYDGKFYTLSEKMKADPNNGFYSWIYSLVADGNVSYSITDGSDGKYPQLYAMNSESISNYLSFRTGTKGYEHAGMTGFAPFGDPFEINTTPLPKEDEGLKLEKKEAIAIADDFLEKVGINTDAVSYRFNDGKRVKEEIDCEKLKDGKSEYYEGIRKCYILRYTRCIDDVSMTVTGGWKNNKTEDFKATDTLKWWPSEEIQFRIDDSGIVGVDYIAPLQVTETIVDNAAIKPFDEIREIFENMITITNADEVCETQISINKIELGYTLISEPDSYDTGLLVPVWDFQGKKQIVREDGYLLSDENLCFTLNAIDGSIIDRKLGY